MPCHSVKHIADGPFSYPSFNLNTGTIIVQKRVGSYLQLFRIKNGSTERLTSDSANHSHPAISMQGDFIAFKKETHGRRDIYLMSTLTKEQFNFTNTPLHNESHPAWGLHDSVIVFNTNRYDSLQEIALIGFHDKKVLRLTEDKEEDTYGSLSPDGTRLLYTKWLENEKNPEIFLMNLSDGEQSRITNNQLRDIAPVWISDSIITYTQSGSIIIHNAITGDQKRLTSLTGFAFGRGVRVNNRSLLCERTKDRKPDGVSILHF